VEPARAVADSRAGVRKEKGRRLAAGPQVGNRQAHPEPEGEPDAAPPDWVG
jgi:hypothetical protein